MQTLSCRTPDMAIKEIWVYLLAYNLIRLIMAQAAWSVPRQISFKHTLQLLDPCRYELSTDMRQEWLELIAQ